jgi:hypothetical protein
MTRDDERNLSSREIVDALLRRERDKARNDRMAKEDYNRTPPLAPQPHPLSPKIPTADEIERAIYGERPSTSPEPGGNDATVYIVEGGGERKRGNQSNRSRGRRSGRGKFGGPGKDVYVNKSRPYSGGPRGRGR